MNEDITFEQMKSAIGSLLMLWARIERTIRTQLSNANGGKLPKSAHGIAAALNTWEAAMQNDSAIRPLQAQLASSIRAELQRPLDIRNGICHGLVGISSSDTDSPATITWRVGETYASITWDELQRVFDLLGKISRAISIISDAAAEKDHAKSASKLPDRDWWIAEFSIDPAASIAMTSNVRPETRHQEKS